MSALQGPSSDSGAQEQPSPATPRERVLPGSSEARMAAVRVLRSGGSQKSLGDSPLPSPSRDGGSGGLHQGAALRLESRLAAAAGPGSPAASVASPSVTGMVADAQQRGREADGSQSPVLARTSSAGDSHILILIDRLLE